METEPKPIALVIEDDEDQNIIFSAALERAGYKVVPAFNGKMAQQLLAEIVPTIVILDLHMPEVNGDVVLKQIRSNPKLKNVRVIVATSDSSFASRMDLDAELVLLKPVGFAQLSQLANRFSHKLEPPVEETQD
jgi:DNA-binding response OmpR family regulator